METAQQGKGQALGVFEKVIQDVMKISSFKQLYDAALYQWNH